MLKPNTISDHWYDTAARTPNHAVDTLTTFFQLQVFISVCMVWSLFVSLKGSLTDHVSQVLSIIKSASETECGRSKFLQNQMETATSSQSLIFSFNLDLT